MRHWEWDPSLSVGIDVIDEQHKQIVDCINTLEMARRENDNEKISAVLSKLVDYTLTHFSFEEDFMEKSGYPLSDSHKQVHVSFAAQINRYVEQHREGKDVARKLMSDLQIWLTNHIKYQDKDYALFIQKSSEKKTGWVGRTVGRLLGKSR